MKKALLIITGAFAGVGLFAMGVICLIYLTSSNGVSVDVRNDSKAVLHNVAVFLPGLPNSGKYYDLSPGESVVSGMPTRMRLAFRVVFDAGEHHYEVPAQMRLLPFGNYSVFISIDDRMQISIRSSHFMGV